MDTFCYLSTVDSAVSKNPHRLLRSEVSTEAFRDGIQRTLVPARPPAAASRHQASRRVLRLIISLMGFNLRLAECLSHMITWHWQAFRPILMVDSFSAKKIHEMVLYDWYKVSPRNDAICLSVTCLLVTQRLKMHANCAEDRSWAPFSRWNCVSYSSVLPSYQQNCIVLTTKVTMLYRW